METLHFTYPAANPAAHRTLVGVVASGDLEVLAEPGQPGVTSILINTSVDGSAHLWQSLCERIFADPTACAVALEINDFGATPGVVRMRVAQALEELTSATPR